MNDMNPCGNHEALVAYLYDECEPAERESIAAHVALCASCAEEIQSLRDTRAHLGAWSPPSVALGFQITRTEADAAAAACSRPLESEAGGVSRCPRGRRWPRPPLSLPPAWASAPCDRRQRDFTGDGDSGAGSPSDGSVPATHGLAR